MRSVIRDTRHLFFTRAETQKNGYEITTVYGEPVGMFATVAPEQGRQSADMYGTRLPYIKRLTGCTAVLQQGDGVWLDAKPADPPDYKVIAVEGYARAVEYVVEKRGVYGG